MKYAVFHDNPTYGLFKIARETKTRWYFEHVAGTDYTKGRVFRYHDKPWLHKYGARRKAITWVEDPSMFDSVVEAHKDMTDAINAINAGAHEDIEITRELFKRRIGDYSTEAPND